MADDMEAMLRNSLNAVDCGWRWACTWRRRALRRDRAGARSGPGHGAGQRGAAGGTALGAFKVLFVAAIAQMLLVACCTGIVMFHVSRVARTILRSMELSKGDR